METLTLNNPGKRTLIVTSQALCHAQGTPHFCRADDSESLSLMKMALKFRAEPPAFQSPWFDDDISASREKLLRAIGKAPDLTFIRGYGNIGDRLIYAGVKSVFSNSTA